MLILPLPPGVPIPVKLSPEFKGVCRVSPKTISIRLICHVRSPDPPKLWTRPTRSFLLCRSQQSFVRRRTQKATSVVYQAT